MAAISIAFFVHRPSNVSITPASEGDDIFLQELVCVGGKLVGEQRAPIERGKTNTFQLAAGVYGLCTETQVSYVVSSPQDVNVVTKGGKDPWPVPPPPPPTPQLGGCSSPWKLPADFLRIGAHSDAHVEITVTARIR